VGILLLLCVTVRAMMRVQYGTCMIVMMTLWEVVNLEEDRWRTSIQV